MCRNQANVAPDLALIFMSALLLAACANRPESIRASYVSFEKYMDLDCSVLETAMSDTRTELTTYSEMQNAKANEDAFGVFLLGIPLSKLSGDVEGEVARLKGEVEAIETAQIRKKCGSLGNGRYVAKRAAPQTDVSSSAPSQPSVRPAARGVPGMPGMPVAGTSWRYEFSDHMYGIKKAAITIEAVAVNAEGVDELVSVEPASESVRSRSRDVRTRKGQFSRYPVGGNFALMEFSPYLLAAGGERALRNVSIEGEGGGYPKGGASGWVTEMDLPVRERVTVPAGTFDAFRVVVRGRRQKWPTTPVDIYTFRLTVWYAPEVKRYVRLEHKTWRAQWGAEGNDVVELVAYRPPS